MDNVVNCGLEAVAGRSQHMCAVLGFYGLLAKYRPPLEWIIEASLD